MEDHKPIELPELLEMKGTAHTCAKLAMQLRREAQECWTKATLLCSQAEELERAARQCHQPKEAKDNDA